jgi:ankyrin repeat protein
LASILGHFEIVKYLVEYGADKESKDGSNKTPLHFASEGGHFEIVKYLVENGAGKDAKDGEDKTPLHRAATNGHFDIVKYFVENGANIWSRTTKGETPLDLAIIGANRSYLYDNRNVIKRAYRAYHKENLAKIIQFLKDKEAENDKNGKQLF